MAKSSVKYAIVQDYETGGLPDKDHQPFIDIALCEVACVVVDMEKLEVIEEYQSLFKPHYKDGLVYTPKALEVNGLTLDMLEEQGKDPKIIYKEIKDLYVKYKNPRQGAIVCGHNFTGFDHPFTIELFKYYGDDVWKYVKWVEDTQKLAYYSSLEQQDYKLATCCSNNDIALVGAHRAIYDTRSNAQLFITYIKKLRGEGAVSQSNVEESFREQFKFQIPS